MELAVDDDIIVEMRGVVVELEKCRQGEKNKDCWQ